MDVISTNADLSTVCRQFAKSQFLAIDTEFMREGTYWSKLCLIQVASPDLAVIIDPLADGLDLTPFLDLLTDTGITKVFHACRQDVEIFFHDYGVIPTPLFDTQIAAMAAGFGEQVSYEALAKAMVKAKIDKASRFTNWARRPLKDSQLKYALADVTHLAALYPKLRKRLEAGNRLSWLDEDHAFLMNPDTYRMDPKDAWKRLRLRKRSVPYLAVLAEVAKWREQMAQDNNKPRNRILKDDAIEELAMTGAHTPERMDDLRAVPKGFGRSKWGQELIAHLADVHENPDTYAPDVPPKPDRQDAIPPSVLDMLKMMLKIRSETEGVASKLIATSGDIDAFARGQLTFTGWRHDVFGKDAQRVLDGEIAFRLNGDHVEMVDL